MEDNNLDKIIKGLMEDFSEDYDPQSWKSLSDRLDSDFPQEGNTAFEDELFDEEVRNAVEDFEEPYQSSTWPILFSKLQAVEAFEFKVLTTKSLEIIMIILLLFSGMQFIPEMGPGYSRTEKTAHIPPADTEKDLSERDQASSMIMKGSSEQPGATLPDETYTYRAKRDQISGSIFSETVSVPSKVKPQQSVEERSVFTGNSVIIHPVTVEPTAAWVRVSSQAIDLRPSRATARKISQTLPGDAPDPLESEKRLWIRGVKPASAAGWSIGAFASTDFNHIITPYDEVYERSGYEQYRIGFGGGISLQYGTRALRLETGLGYSSKHYAPPRVVEIFRGDQHNEFYSISLENIELNTLSIPLNVHYTANPKSKWQFYMMGGLTMNLVIETDYDKTQEAIYALSLPAGGSETEVNYSRSARIEKKDFNKGLFQGGSFNDNNFITFNAGVGLERIIDNKWSVYAQPTYHSNLFGTGLGPNNDKIHIFSLFMGVRMRLE